jgi:ribonuclease P protein component
LGTRPLGYPKAHHLKSRIAIDRVFEVGDVVKSFPFLVRCMPTELPVPTQLMISVPKRRFKRAVDRNRVKRWVREAWRLERSPLESALLLRDEQWAIVLIFVGNEMPDWGVCHAAMKKLVRRLNGHVANGHAAKKPEEHG